MNVCAVCEFWSKVRLRTFGCVAMGSALLSIFRYRLFLYSAGFCVNRVQVVLSGFSMILFCFVKAKTLCRYGCIYFLAALVLVRTDRLHKTGGGLIALIRDNIAFTTTDIPLTINTHNTELQMVMVHINNTKHITRANIYIPPRDTKTPHPRTTKQLTRTYNTAYSTSRTYHTQSSP